MDLGHLAWPFFDASHRAGAPADARWVAAELRAFEEEEGGDGTAARTIFQRLAGAGLLTRTLPGADGRIDLRAVCLLRELCAYGSAIADVALSEPWLGMLPIALHAPEAMRRALAERYAAGAFLPAFALSEPGAGSDARGIATTSRRDGGGFVLDGRKTWTSNAGLADAYVVFARLDDGISAFLVPGDAAGIALEERLRVLPPHTVGTWTLTGCRVPAANLLGAPGQGYRMAMDVLELFRPTVGAACVGFARRALDEALARSRQRAAFGRPIAEHQLVQEKLADMATAVDAAALLVYRAAWQHDRLGRPIRREAAEAKLFASEAAHRVIDQAVQIFGGLGVTRGSAVERLYRHARAFRIFDGTSEIQQLLIARELLHPPR